MRETRQSGSEGGETEPNRSSLPLSPARKVATVNCRWLFRQKCENS